MTVHPTSAASAAPHVDHAARPRSPSAASSPQSKAFADHLGKKGRESASPGGATPASGSPQPSSVAQAPPASPGSAAPGAAGVSGVSGASSSTSTGDIQSSLNQSQDENLQFLELQSQMNTQDETFTTLSNVMKTENDTIKNTAANMAM